MFGYVRAYKPEMKIAEYDTYKAVYCTLCKTLGKQYGIAAKMTLSYDFTFMALLRLSIAKTPCGYTTKRCIYHPFKRCNCLKNHSEELDYTAAVSVILFYYKIKDNLADKGVLSKIKALLMLPFFARYRKKVLKRYPDLDIAAKKMMNSQSALESAHSKDFDMAGEPTAQFLSFAFARSGDDEPVRRILAQMGLCAGRWVYLTDAYDDLYKDIKHGDYNVIAEKFGLYENADDKEIKSALEYAKEAINLYNFGVCEAFELLDTKRYGTILANVLYLGMKDTVKKINDKTKSERKEDK